MCDKGVFVIRSGGLDGAGWDSVGWMDTLLR
jgi:hypothetical protein